MMSDEIVLRHVGERIHHAFPDLLPNEVAALLDQPFAMSATERDAISRHERGVGRSWVLIGWLSAREADRLPSGDA